MNTDRTASPVKQGCSIVWGLAVLAVGAGCLLFAISAPKLGYFGDRARGNEAAALGALKTLLTAQAQFCRDDVDQDTLPDYAPLAELSHHTLVDAVLGAGSKQGYVFVCQPVTRPGSEFLWFAVANPTEPGSTGTRYFATNQGGVIYYSTDGPVAVDPSTCAIPSSESVRPLGR
jgi:hypothetical protein